jgi:hypothetical protein
MTAGVLNEIGLKVAWMELSIAARLNGLSYASKHREDSSGLPTGL